MKKLEVSSARDNGKNDSVQHKIACRRGSDDPLILYPQYDLPAGKAFQPDFGANLGLALVFALEAQNCRNKQESLKKSTLTLCAKPWYAPNL